MRYIESPQTDAYFNMALEEVVFEALPRDDAYFMLWQNRSAVVVGKYQNTAEEINADFVRDNDIQVVRRLSGGGAMYQDLGNLNFTFVVDQQGARALDFALFTEPVVRALARLGVKAETGRRNDILIEGKKFSGNAQYNRGGRTMHHGTLLYNSDLTMIGRALRPKAGRPVAGERIASRAVKSVPGPVANISAAMPKKLPMEAFKKALVAEMFGAGAGLVPYALTRHDLLAAQTLRDEKYATWQWNYGRSPAFDVQRCRRYPFGSVAVSLSVEGGCVRSAAFSGDFFGNGDVAELAARLQGLPLQREAVLPALEKAEVGEYILGMDAETLADLLVG